MNSWFRFYNEVVDDPKVQRLPPALFRIWVNLLCLASGNGGSLPAIEDCSYKLRMTTERTDQHISQLITAGLFDREGDKVTPHNWNGRQFRSDRNKGERVLTDGKSKYIYLAGAPGSNLVKIGFSRNPWARLIELRTGSVEELEILAMFKSAAKSEVDIHVLLSAFHHEREWFKLPDDLLATIKTAAEHKATYDELLEQLRSKHVGLLRSEPTSVTTTITTIQNRSDTDTDTDYVVPKNGGGKPETGTCVYSPDFEQFWSAYPKHVGKGDAFKAWKKLKPSVVLRETIIAAVDEQKRSPQWRRDHGQYIPNPSTWLNQSRWDDSLDLHRKATDPPEYAG